MTTSTDEKMGPHVSPPRKKLIEVALPLEVLNRESAREKRIKHGHPSTVHLWWARRPLAACRALIFASIIDDPASRTEDFPTEEAQDRERARLFRIMEELARWENTNNEAVLGAAQAEIRKATGGDPPPVLDPFCGGGSIPLEAQRLGLETHASDLNPVAALITKALIEIPPKFAGRPPVNPESRAKLANDSAWTGAKGLAEDVRYYGRWMRDEALRRIGHLYPTTKLSDGSEAAVIAWLWARTANCPNPACGARMPLLNGFALSNRRGHEAWLDPRVDRVRRSVSFEIGSGPGRPTGGTIGRHGASCLVCGEAAPLSYIRQEGREGRMSAKLVCVVAEGERRREYLPAAPDHSRAADVQAPDDVPTTSLPSSALGFRVQGYGLTEHHQLFTNRQLVALTTFSDLVLAARDRVAADCGDDDYADAIATYLTLGIGRLANRSSSQCFWDPGPGKVQQVFARNALPMIWVYAEANPFSESSGNFLGQLEYLANALAGTPARGVATARQLDAASVDGHESALVVTDPPYYDNVPYADLSDFFYIWLRRSGSPLHPDLFTTLLVPKTQELIAEPARHGGWDAAARFFEAGLRTVFDRLRALQNHDYPLVVIYAFKQAEQADDGNGRASTGWETMLQGLMDAGFSITGTWPMRTEQAGGLRELRRNSLASSIALACRPRLEAAPLATRKEFISALRAELPPALRHLQHGNIAPVDLAQAAIGPGMAIFSGYAKVLEADGSPMRVRTALGLINRALDEVLAEQESEFDPATRWALAWFEQRGGDEGPFGEADVLARAKNTSVQGMVDAGIAHARAGKVRLLSRDELDGNWDPATDRRLTIWEVAQHLIRRLEAEGDQGAAELLRRVHDGEVARDLAYRLYTTCERKGWAQDALAYNALVVAWPEVVRIAGQEPAGIQTDLDL